MTSGFIAPTGRRGATADVFALGVTAYLYATGVHPHNPLLDWESALAGKESKKIFCEAGQRAIDFVRRRDSDALLDHLRPDLPADLVQVIEECLSAELTRRPSLDVLCELSEPIEGQRVRDVFGVDDAPSAPAEKPATTPPLERSRYARNTVAENIAAAGEIFSTIGPRY
jgi:hypothetical protein